MDKKKLFSGMLILALCLSLFAACDQGGKEESGFTEHDYVAELQLDMTSSTKKQEVTVKNFVDGDTTHFHVPTSVMESGVLKARYLGINTPESTGQIEEYGKAASIFTKEHLSKATSIIIESDDDKWNLDTSGGRVLSWVWYRTSNDEPYRNLNLELLQNGLARAYNSGQNRYGETMLKALAQARYLKLGVFSGQPDPDFYYGTAAELTLKELRCNIASYNNQKVAFNGVITMHNNNSCYIEDYDEETGMYYGITIYYGYSMSGDGMNILNAGNYARIVGTVQYYETGGTYQVAGLTYKMMKPNDPENIQCIESGHEPAFFATKPETFRNGKVAVTFEDEDGNAEVKEFAYAELAMSTSISMENLYVKSIYTTNDEESSSYGAMTLTCEANGCTIYVRTIPFRDEESNLISEDLYKGKTIDVKGLVDYFNGSYQIKVLRQSDIIIH